MHAVSRCPCIADGVSRAHFDAGRLSEPGLLSAERVSRAAELRRGRWLETLHKTAGVCSMRAVLLADTCVSAAQPDVGQVCVTMCW